MFRGRSGLRPTAAPEAALDGLKAAYGTLDWASDKLHFQRSLENHIVAGPDWTDAWLVPRLGAADVMTNRDPNGQATDDTARYLPVGMRDDRGAMWRHSKHVSLEGFPLLHIQLREEAPDTPTWVGRKPLPGLRSRDSSTGQCRKRRGRHPRWMR